MIVWFVWLVLVVRVVIVVLVVLVVLVVRVAIVVRVWSVWSVSCLVASVHENTSPALVSILDQVSCGDSTRISLMRSTDTHASPAHTNLTHHPRQRAEDKAFVDQRMVSRL